MRARDIGIEIGRGVPGQKNRITDVPGVRVGHATIVRGDGPLVVGKGPVRTGVTIVMPNRDVWALPVFAGYHRLNGNGEVTGVLWVKESGMLTSPIGLTNTGSVGVVRDTLLALEARARIGNDTWSLPVVGETWDGRLNDLFGFHVRPEHVEQAVANASAGPVPEGNVGGGTGMICHGFKGGIGTSSRSVHLDPLDCTLGVLVQANHGRRERLMIEGIPVGELLPASEIPLPDDPPEGSTCSSSSIIVVVATDAPLLPHQCERVAQRAGLGVARTGGVGEHSSGDIFIAFSTGNEGFVFSGRGCPQPSTRQVNMLSDGCIDALFDAAVEATEEAIVNALLAAETMKGRDDLVARAIPHDRLIETMRTARSSS